MFEPNNPPEEWLSSRTLPRIPRERLPFGRSLTQATFEWIDVARELIGTAPGTRPEPPVTPPKPVEPSPPITPRPPITPLAPGEPPRPEPPGVLAAPLILGPYSIEQIGQRVELRIGAVTRWVVDAAAFGGTAQVTLTTAPGTADVALADAFYPGTTIPADLKARIFNDQGTWQIRLRLKFGAFDTTIPLQPWLDRTAPAVSLVALDLSCCPLGPASDLRADGVAAAGFTPDWVLGVFGPDDFLLNGFSDRVTADLALIVPIAAGGPSFLLPQTFRRTAILLFSDTQFPLVPELSSAWPRFRRGTFRFDGFALEAGLDSANVATRVLFAQSVNDPEHLGFEPAADLRGTDGQEFRLRVQNARYAIVFDAARTRRLSALMAQVNEVPQWMHAAGCSLVVTRSNTLPNLVVLDVAGGNVSVLCRVRTPEMAFQVPDMLVRPTPAPPRMELVFTWGPLAAPLPPGAGHVEIDPVAGTSALRLPRDLTLDMVRRDDFLVLAYLFDNLRFEGAGPSRHFLRDGPTDPPFLIVTLPPQSVGEEAFFETATGFPPGQTNAPLPPPPPKNPDPPPVKALLARPSRLAFHVPDAVAPLVLSVPRLLKWTDLTPSLAPTALPGQSILVQPGKPDIVLVEHPLAINQIVLRAAGRAVPSIVRSPSRNARPFDRLKVAGGLLLQPAAPTPTTTAIEAPFRLIISPNKYGAWKHAVTPVIHDGRAELWHTRLGVLSGADVDEEQTLHRNVRAIWARDFTLTSPDDRPFLMSLSQDDRRILVRLTSDYTITPPPIPVGVNRLMLTALGAWMDTEVKFDPPAQLPIEEWQHRATLGRDHFVKVVYPGHLYGLGNRASVVKVTERKVQPTPSGDPAAYLRQRIFVIVKEPERTYTAAGYAKGGREFPFKRVRILTKKTPNLDPPGNNPLGAVFAPAPLAKFWPHVLGQPFRFHVKAWDWEDRETDFTIPLAFVRTDQASKPDGSPDNAALAAIIGDYNAAAQGLRSSPLGGQGVSYAETDAASKGKTRFETDQVLVKALAPVPARTNAKATPTYPQLENAVVSIPALRQLAGSAGTATITLKPYIDLGFAGGNPAKLFADVQGASLDYAGKADKSGAVVTPSLQIRGLARELGAVGDAGSAMQTGTFKPADFFNGASPKLLGGISLVDIILEASGAEFLQKTPKLVTENRDDLIRTAVDWATDKLKKSANGFVPSLSDGGATATLKLSSVLLTRKDTGATDFTLSGELRNFRLSLFDVIEVAFKVFQFKSENGKKPDFHVELDGAGFKFLGNLEFVNEVVKVLDTANFSDPPFLDISPQGLALGYTLTIPTVAVGVVGISNIALGARLSLPFTGEPARLRFNLSERQSPFIVSVAPFGGGGFFAIAVGVDGLEVLEASLEFGGNLSIDLGVASGGVYVMAGIYFKIKMSAPESSELTGYVRLGGSLSVLGIVSISIEFYLGLSYGDGKAWGEARVTVTVKVLLFSGDVTVRCKREFAGSSGDPPFRELMPHNRWQAYAAAFA